MIVVVEYDRRGRGASERLRRQYAAAMAAAGVRVVAIEHVGSTAVSGLAAKPVIDCDVVLAAPDVAAGSRVLTGLGFTPLGELGIPLRLGIQRAQAAGRNQHLPGGGRIAVAATAASIDEYGRAKNAMVQRSWPPPD